MSCVVVLAPAIYASWPMLAAAVTAAAAKASIGALHNRGQARLPCSSVRSTREIVEIPDSRILEDSRGGRGEIVIEEAGVRAVFRRDERGALALCMEGNGIRRAELRRIGEELVARVTQQFVYNRIVAELRSRRLAIVDEQVEADRTVRLRVRSL